jgi:hypothetical protein
MESSANTLRTEEDSFQSMSSEKAPAPKGDPKPQPTPERKDPQPDTDLRRDPEPNPIPGRGPLQAIPTSNIPKQSHASPAPDEKTSPHAKEDKP